MVKNKIISTIGIMFCLLSVNSYGAAQNIVKPKINSIAFFSGKWHIDYNELKNGTNLLKEELFVDGNSDRIVTIGTGEKRGFPLHGNYDRDICHKAYVVVYDKSHNVVTKSDTFEFGDTSKCDVPEPLDTLAPVITLSGKNLQVITKGQVYKELGAIALDNRDGDLTKSIVIDSSDVDVSTVGEYRVKYTVEDAAENNISVTRVVKVVVEDFMGELEIHSLNFYKEKWYIKYQDLRKVKALKKEILFIDGNEVRTVTGGYNRSHDRGFAFAGEGYDKDACHKAYIVAYDYDDNNLSQSDVFEFGNVSKCGTATDTVKPVITLVGTNPQTLTVGQSYAELSARATDDVDGNITSNIIIDATAIDTSKAGTYIVKYNVKDSANNSADEVIRTINVITSSLPCVAQGEMKGRANGLFTATLNWENPLVDMEMTNPLMVKQEKSCTSFAMGSADLTLFSVYPGHYPIVIDVKDSENVLETQLPDHITLDVTTPGEGKILQKEINFIDDYYRLGHIADIWIWRPKVDEPPVVLSIPTYSSAGSAGGWGGSGWYSYSRGGFGTGIYRESLISVENRLCTPALSCGCKPCKYGVLEFLNQVNLGPISGGTYRIYKATDFGKADIEYLYESETTVGNDIDKAGIMDFPIKIKGRELRTPEQIAFMSKIENYDGDFIIEVVGGVDIDIDSDWEVDADYTPFNGKAHAIVSKEELLNREYKVNILTELSFQVSQDLLGSNYNQQQLDSRLNDIAKKVLIEKLYPFSDKELGRDDVVYWMPNANKTWLVKDYNRDLHNIVLKLHRGEYIKDDASTFIYGGIHSQVPVLGTTWYYVDENISGGTFIGSVKVLSEGNSSIVSFLMDENDNFRIDSEGKVYLKDSASLDYETKQQHDLFVSATNSQGESRPIQLRVLLNDIADAPTFLEFKDGSIKEDAEAGAYVGQVIYRENGGAIDGYSLSGADASEFEIDDDGNITVSASANLDYEQYYAKRVTVTAHNSLGTSFVTHLTIQILDAIDVPSIEAKEVHLAEDALAGAVVVDLNISSLIAVDSVALLGDANRTFTIDTDGVVRVSATADIDYEKKIDYLLNVVAVNANGVSRPASLHIIVDNVNDAPTVGVSNYSLYFNAPANHMVGEITVTNVGASPITNYSLSGEGSSNFTVNSSGEILVNANNSLASYQNATLYLTATATNASGKSLPGRVAISVYSDRPFVGTLHTYVDENAPSGTVVGKVPFRSESAINSMRLEGEGSSKFTIANDGTVKVATGVTIDYEDVASYTLTLYATNSAGEGTGGQVYISVYDLEDTIKIQGFGTTVYEDASDGQLIGIVRTTYLGGKTLDHFELTGVGASNFEVTSDGKVKVATGATFNSVTTPHYRLPLVAIATDGERSNEVYLDITVSKSINTVPQITNLAITLDENASVGTEVGQLTIVSRTRVVDAVWFEGVGKDDFAVDTTGRITIRKSLDFERQPSYTLSVFATNALGRSTEAKFTVTINNLLDDEPQLADTTLSVDENAPVGIVVGKVSVLSNGSSPITSMTLVGSGKEKFAISADGNVTTTTVLNFEAISSYSLQVKAINAKAESALVNLVINVNNLPEIKPVLYNFRGFVEENATAGTELGAISFATGGDSTITAYGLTGAGHENFVIEDGIVKVSAVADLNESLQKEYNLSMTATNGIGTSESVSATIIVTFDKSKPAKPSNIELLDIAHNSLTLGWSDNSENERGFNLYKDGVKIVLDKNATSHRVADLIVEHSYNFVLKAFNDRGESQGLSITGITDIDRSGYLKTVLESKCNINETTFNTNFNVDTGVYAGNLYCYSQGIDNNELLNFKALKEVTGYLYLQHNSFSNVDGLSNLRKVGRYLYLNNNQLTQVDGLARLKTVGYDLHLENNELRNLNGLNKLTRVGNSLTLENNKLVDIDGLSSLVYVGQQFNINNNRLTNVNGLSALKYVGNHLSLENNNLTNLDGLSSLTTVRGYLAIRNNSRLTDISGISNMVGSRGKLLYIDADQYTSKATEGSSFCSTTWDLRDSGGNIDDNMTQVCESSTAYVPTAEDKFRDILGRKFGIASTTFYSAFDTETGVYTGSLDSYNQGLTDEELANFSILTKVTGYLQLRNSQITSLSGLSSLTEVNGLYIYNNNQLVNVDGLESLTTVRGDLYLINNQLTNVNGLSSLETVGGSLSLQNNKLTNVNGLSSLASVRYDIQVQNNPDLVNISGLSNVSGNDGRLFYIDNNQYTTKATEGSNLCTTVWDLRTGSGNIADDMNKVCNGTAVEPTPIEKFRTILGAKCNISSATFNTAFNRETGVFSGNIRCQSSGLTDAELLDFRVLTKVTGYIYLYNNQLTTLEGLNNLTTVGGDFYLSGNQLTNVDGLSSLTSIARTVYLNSNKIENLNGLSFLTYIGGSLELSTNLLENLDGLLHLTSVGGSINIRNNPSLVDISGLTNTQGVNGRQLYIDLEQYTAKASEELAFCATTWNLIDTVGNDIDDDLSLVCSPEEALTDEQKFRKVLNEKCAVSFTDFANNYDETGIYTGSLDCGHRGLTSTDLDKFSVLNSVTGSFSLNHNDLSNLDGLTNLSSVGGYFYIHNNQLSDVTGLNSLANIRGNFNLSNNILLSNLDGLNSLTNISGWIKIYNNSALEDISAMGSVLAEYGQKLYIDSRDYGTKIPLSDALCSVTLDLYDTNGQIADDMSKVCDGYIYTPTEADKLRDILGKRCSIDSATFYGNFAEDTGIYTGDISCHNLTESEMNNFTALLEVEGNFAIEDSSVTTLDELIRLKKVTGQLSIKNNTQLTNISGLSNVEGVANQRLVIDDDQYSNKADNSKEFCATSWDLYNGSTNIGNDMTKVCSE